MIDALVSYETARQVQLSNRKVGQRTVSGRTQKCVLMWATSRAVSEAELSAMSAIGRRTLRYALRALEEQNLVNWSRKK